MATTALPAFVTITTYAVLGGVLAICLTACLGAFLLVRDADRLSDEAMVAHFQRRAAAADLAAGVAAVAGILVLLTVLDQKSPLPEEGMPEPTPTP